MANVSEIAKRHNVSKNTVRGWAREFGDYLSASANPPKGKQRTFTDRDEKILAFIGYLRAQSVGYEDIQERLSVGEFEQIDLTEYQPGQDIGPVVPVEVVDRLSRQYQSQIENLENERNYLRSQLSETEKKWVDAERRAATAEAQLNVLSGTTKEPN